MEGTTKRVVAACCLLVILVSVQQRQVAAMSKFCCCYTKCYADCRKNLPPYPCNFECLQDCINGQPPPSSRRPASPGPADCKYACLIRTCGVMDAAMTIPAGDAEACVYDCTNKLGAFAPTSAAKTN